MADPWLGFKLLLELRKMNLDSSDGAVVRVIARWLHTAVQAAHSTPATAVCPGASRKLQESQHVPPGIPKPCTEANNGDRSFFAYFCSS